MIPRPPRSTRPDTTLSLHDALPRWRRRRLHGLDRAVRRTGFRLSGRYPAGRCADRIDRGGHDLRLGTLYGARRLALRNRQLRRFGADRRPIPAFRSEEHTSELQSLMRISYAVFCLTKKTHTN